MKCLGIIAGGGDSPVIAAKNARGQGWRVVVSMLEEVGESFPEDQADAVRTISLAKAGTMREFFESEGVTDVLIIGKVDKTLNFAGHEFDATALSMLSRLAGRGDIQIAQVVIEELVHLGFGVRKQTEFLGELILPEGILCGDINDAQKQDIEKGLQVAKSLSAHDIGQTVVIREGAVIAVEAFEHTDETIRRAGELVESGHVVVKVARPNQDLRFDVPAVGPDTISAVAGAQGKVLAAQAGCTFMFDKDNMINLAKEKGIAIVGVKYNEE